jgi:hypothetical protein
MTHTFKVNPKTFELSIFYDDIQTSFSMQPFADVENATIYGEEFVAIWNNPKRVGENAIFPNLTLPEVIPNPNA